ncbi:AAA family ATPase [Streptomyces sp. NPDC059564]|uniref:AAA family ATPase n=1 Tax=Streptomyces sp. NPDC059564 TaxID=3346865 RepID=UPI0036C1B0D8
MTAEELEGITRRRLVIVAVGGYEASPPGFDEAIAAQVERITGWLADPTLDEDRRFEVSRAPAVRSVRDLRAFLHDENLAAADYQEAVVVYITGHGLCRSTQRHYLTLAETDPERLLATAFPTSELITGVLDSESEHVLVLVDSCFSGNLNAELSSLRQDLSPDRLTADGVVVITAGLHHEQPRVGSFTERVALAYERMQDEAAGYTASHLSFREWEKLLDEVGEDEDGREKDLISAEWVVPGKPGKRLSACLPNPRYRPAVSTAGPALRQLTLTRTTGTGASLSPLDEFWLERASGRATDDDPGWYFSGRAEPMRVLAGFLRNDERNNGREGEGHGVLVVTGAAGSGKSALLARVVTLSDPAFTADPQYAAMVAGIPAELRPDPGTVDIAVLARNKSARTVVEDLLSAFGAVENEEGSGTGVPLQDLLQRMAASNEGAAGHVTVVIDALDEAQDPLALLNDVVLPLARLTTPDGGRPVRLLLGIRSSPLMGHQGEAQLRDDRADHLLLRLEEALGSEGVRPRILRSDGPHCADDIAAYAATLLLTPSDSPYHGAAEAAEAARVIADAVAPSFLDARIAADQLRKATSLQDLTEEGWLDRLADGTIGLLREDIKAVSASTGVPADLLATVLRATTFAPGAGLPWAEVWPAVTVALAAAEYGPGYVGTDTAGHAIRTLRASRLTGYLATAEEDARTVYRPVHQRLTDLLLADHDWLLAPPSATASSHWHPATSPRALVEAHVEITRALADLVERSWPHPAHPYVRRHFLHHAAAGEVLSDASVPPKLLAQEVSGTLRARLGLPLPTADRERRMLTAAALIEPYVDESVDVASRASSIAFQRGVRGEPWEASDRFPAVLAWGRWAARANVLAPTRGETQSLCVVPTLDGRTLIAVMSRRGHVEIRDAATGRLAAEIASETEPVRSLCPIRTAGGRTFLVAGNSDSVTIHDPTSGQPIAHAPFPIAEEVHVLKDGSAKWELFVLTAQGAFLWRPTARDSHDAGTGRVSRAEDFPAVRRVASRNSTAVVRTADGHALVAVVTRDGIRLWDPASGLTAHPLFGGTGAYAPMAVARQGEDDVLLIRNGVAAASLRQLWDPFRGEPVPHRRIDGHAVTVLPGGRTLAYAEVGRIVVRDIDGTAEEYLEGDIASVNAIAALEGPTGLRIVSAELEGIRLWDLGRNGEPEAPSSTEILNRLWWERPGRGGLWTLIRPEGRLSDGTDGLVAVATGEGLDVHDAATGKRLRVIRTGPAMSAEPVPSPPGTSYVVVAGRTGWSMWDLVSGETVGRLPTDRYSYTRSCIVRMPTDLLLFAVLERDGEIRCTTWDPATGETAVSTATYHQRVEQARACAALPPGSAGGTNVIAVVGTDGIDLVDLASGNLVRMLRAEGRRLRVYVAQCVLQLRERTLLAAVTPSALHVWDTSDGTLLAACPVRDTQALAALPLPDGRTLLALGNPGGVQIRDPLTGELRHTLLTGAPVHALAAGTGPKGTALHIHGPAGLATLTLDERLL